MDMKEALAKRLADLDISPYELAHRVAEIRNANGEHTTVSNIQSAVAKAVKEPDGRRYKAIAEIVEALGGELVVRWHNIEEIKLAS